MKKAAVIVSFLLTASPMLFGQQYSQFLAEQGTAQPESDGNSEYRLGDFDGDGKSDVFVIGVRNTGTKMTEVHVLTSSSGYSQFGLHTGTAQGYGNAGAHFEMGDFDGDGKSDLFFIKTTATGTNMTEVHVMCAATNYARFFMETGTPQPMETDATINSNTYEYRLGDYDGDKKADLYIIRTKPLAGTTINNVQQRDNGGAGGGKPGAGQRGGIAPTPTPSSAGAVGGGDRGDDNGKNVYVSILSGASNYSQFIVKPTPTTFPVDNGEFEYQVADYDGDGKADLVGIKKTATGSGKLEVHVASAASGFAQFVQQTPTALGMNDGTYEYRMGDYNADGKPDLFALRLRNTGTHSLELHVLGAASAKTFTTYKIVTHISDVDLAGTDNLVYMTLGFANGTNSQTFELKGAHERNGTYDFYTSGIGDNGGVNRIMIDVEGTIADKVSIDWITVERVVNSVQVDGRATFNINKEMGYDPENFNANSYTPPTN